MQPNRVKVLARQGSDISGAGSESDSLLDLYGNHSGNRSGVSSLYRGEGNTANGDVFLEDEDPESSRWIHRDKLARIEIEEMQQAGIKIGNNSRPGSKRTNVRERSREHQQNLVPVADNQPVHETRQRLPLVETEEQNHHEPISLEIRRLEEVAADASADRGLPNSQARRLGRKSSYSKIPLSKASPIPVPQDYIERHAPSHRHGSGGWGSLDEDGILYKKVRSRSHSVGSQMLLDDQEGGGRSTPTLGSRPTSQGSPFKVRGIPRPSSNSPATRVSASRDSSAQHKPRIRSGQVRDSPGQRPATRSGETPPGNSIKRPEGDPPWLATMYKPDPRLPPEEQLIPTVAKRLQHEQWEREGKISSTYDRELNPIGGPEDELNEVKPPVAEEKEKEQTNEQEVEWPLKSQKSPVTAGESGANITEHGGYKVIPHVERSASANPIPAPLPVQPIDVEAQEEAKEKKKKEAGCACCLVM